MNSGLSRPFRDEHARDRAWGRWLRKHCTRPIIQRVRGEDLPRPLSNHERLAAWARDYYHLQGSPARLFPALPPSGRARQEN